MADTIVVATIVSDHARSNRPLSEMDDATFELTNIALLKGRAPARVHYPEGEWLPPTAAVQALAGRRAILFLTRANNGAAYFAGHFGTPLLPATSPIVAAVQAELARQARVTRQWKAASKASPHYERVHRIIEQIAKLDPKAKGARRRQQDLFGRLEALGPEAVPAIIALMDDGRPLPFKEITLRNNFPEAFEETRIYGPELIVNGLASELNQLTWEDFGCQDGCSNAQDRHAEVDGWRVYAVSLTTPEGRERLAKMTRMVAAYRTAHPVQTHPPSDAPPPI